MRFTTFEKAGNIMSAYSAHVDTFAHDNLPPRKQWPNLIFTLPDGMVVESQCLVVRSHPRRGMGVRFTSLSLEQSNYIRQFIHA